MTEDDLSHFPTIERFYHGRLGRPGVSGTVVEDLFDGALCSGRLEKVENIFKSLIDDGFPEDDLDEQVLRIFIPKPKEKWHKWWTLETELWAFEYLRDRRILGAIGYPQGGPGNSPEFDGLIQNVHKGKGLPFDVKTAANSGVELLEARLDEASKTWRQQNGIGKVDFEIRSQGVILTQVNVGASIKDIILLFLNKLKSHSCLPVEISFPFPSGGVVNLRIVGDEEEMILGGHTGSPNCRQDAADQIVEGHVRSKLAMAKKICEPFCLIYVALPNRGAADLHANNIVDATKRALNQNTGLELFVGTVFLDFVTDGSSKCSHWNSGNTLFSDGLSPGDLENHLKM